MIRRYGIALTVFGVFIVLAAGSAQAGMVGHISTIPAGPALNLGPVPDEGGKIESPADLKKVEHSSEYQGREAVGTGNLPESVESRSDDAKILGNGEKLDRRDVDAGP